MTVLLDTHTVLWATLTPAMLSPEARSFVIDPRNQLFVSAASAYEIANKVRMGKLPGAVALEREFLYMIAEAGFTPLPVDGGSALRAGRMVGEYRDPWDRILAAQALTLDIPIISIDTSLDAFVVRRIW